MVAIDGPWGNHGRIRWNYTVAAINQGSTTAIAWVEAAFQMDGSSSQGYTGSKSWSGHWGSGSASQNYTLGPSQQVTIVTGGGTAVTLTDAAQTRVFSATANHWFGTTSHSVNVWYPARYAVTPTALTATRISDGQINLAWTRNSTYTSVVVQRRTNGGAWQTVGQPTGNAASFSDLTTTAGNRYEYRVAGVGGSGQSYWSSIVTVYTTPNAPAQVSAVRVGASDIQVDAATMPPYFASVDIMDDASIVATGVTLPWLDVAPNPSVAHTYRVRANQSGLQSAWSDPSNTVQLLAAPNAPTSLAPNGGSAASDVPVRFSWVHNPVDSSAQTAYELRYRIGVGAWTTLSGTTAQFRDVTLSEAAYEWQTRTKGAHADWSPWSATATVTVITRPGVAITVPGPTYDLPTLPATWTWFQAQSLPQSNWEAVLLDGDLAQLEARSGANASTTVTFTTRLEHGRTYTVRARAATGAVWSEWAEQAFTVEFVAPAPAAVDGVWVEEAGAVELAVTAQMGTMPDIVNHAPSLYGATSAITVWRNLVPSPVAFSAGLEFTRCTISASGGVVTGTVNAVGFFPRVITAQAVRGQFPVTPGDQMTGSFLMHTNGVTYNFRMQWFTTPSTSLSVTSTTAHTGVAGQYVTRTETVPAGAVYGQIEIGVADNTPISTQFAYSEPMFVVGAQRLPFFAVGLPSPDPDMAPAWAGTAETTPTLLRGQIPTGYTASNCAAVIHEDPEGRRELRVIPNTGSGDSFVAFTIPAAARGGGVFAAKRWQAGPVSTTTTSQRARNLTVHSSAVQQQAPFPRPNVAGDDEVRLAYVAIADYWQARLYHGGVRGADEVRWREISLLPTGYDGPLFDEKTGRVEIDGHWYDTEADSGHSKAVSAPVTETVQVERSVDGGESWEPLAAGIVPDENGDIHLTDWESLSHGATVYRVTTYAASGASMAVTPEVVADSGALWLSGGPGFARTARLPFDPKVSLDAGRARALKRYAGREFPVAYSGEAVTRTIQVSGRTADEALAGQSTADVEALTDVALERSPVHMFRDPDGRRVYGVIGSVQMPRETVTTGHARPWNGIWGYGFTLTETGR